MHGGPVDECPDDERDWFPQRRVCWPAAQLKAARRMYALLHEERPYHDGTWQVWAEKASLETPFHFTDGVSLFLAETDYDPADKFLTDVQAAPTLGRVGSVLDPAERSAESDQADEDD